jgi:hypothetical protein
VPRIVECVQENQNREVSHRRVRVCTTLSTIAGRRVYRRCRQKGARVRPSQDRVRKGAQLD